MDMLKELKKLDKRFKELREGSQIFLLEYIENFLDTKERE